MRSAAQFVALMMTGVLVVLIYIWSGESMAALVMSILTLFAVAAIVEWRPWDPARTAELSPIGARRTLSRALRNRSDGVRRFGRPNRRRATGSPVGSRSHRSDDHDADDSDDGDHDHPVWRGRFDVTWDQRGISGVELGRAAPQLWAWSQVDDITRAWCPAIEGTNSSDDHDDDDDERIGLCLDFPSLRNREEPETAVVMFGPDQLPETVVHELRLAWRESKITRSRFFDLSPEERTREMGEHFGQQPIDLTDSPRSPELLYREVRRALLSSGELCRLAPEATFEEVLDTFDRLLEANGVDLLSRTEADELAASDGPEHVASLHGTLDWVAEQRGFRLAFIDQGGRDYLIGLIPAQYADDWDGQTVGSGATRIMLDLPS